MLHKMLHKRVTTETRSNSETKIWHFLKSIGGSLMIVEIINTNDCQVP